MKHLKTGRCYSSILLILVLAITVGCSSSDSATVNVPSNAYSTTSSKGDYSEWTLTGSLLEVTWNLVGTSGAIEFTYDFSATCGGADTFGVRNCTIDASTSSCTDGVLTCTDTATGSFDMMDVPGVALFVHTGSGSSAQLHVGFTKDSTACSQDVSGDYTMMATGLGLNENFGVYRSDSNFINIMHADFGFDTPDTNVTQSVAYRTGTESEMLVDDGCVDGVRTRTVGGEQMRSMITASGLFILDLPAGQGGLVSFKTSNAATLADFAGKSFGGISFPDNSAPEPLRADFGALTGSQIDATVVTDLATDNFNIKTLTTPATSTNPSYPDFTLSPTGYNASVLSMDYADPASIPGLFKIDNGSDTGRIIIAAMKFNNKVIGVGMVYNLRTTTDINPSTGMTFAADGLYNTGNFLLFEK